MPKRQKQQQRKEPAQGIEKASFHKTKDPKIKRKKMHSHEDDEISRSLYAWKLELLNVCDFIS